MRFRPCIAARFGLTLAFGAFLLPQAYAVGTLTESPDYELVGVIGGASRGHDVALIRSKKIKDRTEAVREGEELYPGSGMRVEKIEDRRVVVATRTGEIEIVHNSFPDDSMESGGYGPAYSSNVNMMQGYSSPEPANEQMPPPALRPQADGTYRDARGFSYPPPPPPPPLPQRMDGGAGWVRSLPPPNMVPEGGFDNDRNE